VTNRETAERKKLYDLPLDGKLGVIQRIYIRTNDISRARYVFEDIMHRGKRLRECKTGWVIGESRCGKSETAKRVISEYTGANFLAGEPYQLIEGNGYRIVFADLTNGATPLVASQAILTELFSDSKALRMKATQAAGRIIEVFREQEIDLFVIDETQQMFRGHGPWGAVVLGNWLLGLQNSNVVPMVCIGAPELREVFLQVKPIRDRKGPEANLDPFPFATEVDRGIFGEFVAAFERDLPFPKTCLTAGTGKCSGKRLLEIYFATRGTRGVLANLAEQATKEAFLREPNPATLELDDFIKAFDVLLKHDERMRGINPFAVRDVKDIPTIPYTAKEAEDDRLEALFGKPRRRKTSKANPGGRISEFR